MGHRWELSGQRTDVLPRQAPVSAFPLLPALQTHVTKWPTEVPQLVIVHALQAQPVPVNSLSSPPPPQPLSSYPYFSTRCHQAPSCLCPKPGVILSSSLSFTAPHPPSPNSISSAPLRSVCFSLPLLSCPSPPSQPSPSWPPIWLPCL